MRSLRTLALGLAAIAATVVAAEEASDVHVLGKDTFADFVKENDLVLAECKSPAPSGTRLPANSSVYSLRAVVRSLQGARSRVRGGCHDPQGQEHQARQGRLHG
jgi:hypothetical protein